MKEETQPSHENNENHGRGVFASGRKWVLESKKHRNTPWTRENRRADLKKVLVNLWSGHRITKIAYAGRGQETKWEMGG
jgi:hypothetical protein